MTRGKQTCKEIYKQKTQTKILEKVKNMNLNLCICKQMPLVNRSYWENRAISNNLGKPLFSLFNSENSS